MKKGQGWTKEQVDYLIAHYPSERAEDIAVVIGKTKSGVQHKAHYLGIGKDPEGFFKVRSNAMSGVNSGNFKGYRRRTPKGYIVRYVPDHPMASANGLVMEHRLIIEESLGNYLPPEFDVHHINGIKDDNRIENLAVMTHKAHTAFHNKQDQRVPRGEKNKQFKNIDLGKLKKLRESGMTVNQVCKELKIGRTKYYSSLRSA